MIRKEIIDLIADKTKINQREFIEKDLILQRLLLELSYNKEFSQNYTFKGGTCLIKCYLGYYRFSEDLDFTWINQDKFKNKSQKELRRILSKKIDEILIIVKESTDKIRLDFKIDKKDRRYITYGISNKQITFKIWYTPQGDDKEKFIKVQINFVEKLFYPISKRNADNIFFGRYDNFEVAFLLPEESEWLLKIPNVKCYDIREILIEKVRAIVTRKALKARDFIDVFLITKENKIKLENFKEQVIDKTKFMLKYEKYIQNLKNFNIENIVFGEEVKLLLIPINEDEFSNFIKKISPFLFEIVNEIKK